MKVTYILLFAVLCLALTGTAVSLWFLGRTPEAMQTTERKVYKVGVISPGGAYSEAFEGLRDGLTHLGYADGTNVSYIIKDMAGKNEQAPQMIEDLLAEKPDVIYSLSTPTTTKVKELVGNRIPVVFNIVGDPVGSGFIESFSAPGGNYTGCSNLSAELSGKRLEVFKSAFPSLKRVVTFYDPANKFSISSIENAKHAAAILQITLEEKQVKDVSELKTALDSVEAGQYDGIFNTPDSMVVSNIDVVIERAAELSIPVMGHEETLVRKGATLSYGASFYRLGHQCATLVDDVLQGANPADVPIGTPEKIELVINMKSFEGASHAISPEIIKRADKIIQ